MSTERNLGLIWGYWFAHLLIDPLSHYQHMNNGWSTKHQKLFWCTGKAAKEPCTESTVVNEKKKQRDNPTARIRKFQESWKETFPWVVHDANQDVMYCSTCRRYPAFANLQSSLYIGCGSGGKYRIDSLVHHNASKEHYRCSLGWQLTVVHHLEIHPLCTGQPLAQNYHSTKDYQCL